MHLHIIVVMNVNVATNNQEITNHILHHGVFLYIYVFFISIPESVHKSLNTSVLLCKYLSDMLLFIDTEEYRDKHGPIFLSDVKNREKSELSSPLEFF